MDAPQDLVKRLATLARLNLMSDEQAAFAQQIPKILAYVQQLSQVDTTAVAADETMPFAPRADEVRAVVQPDTILDRAPERLDRFWKVPPVK